METNTVPLRSLRALRLIKIKPRRVLRTRRGLRNNIGMEARPESFACSASSAVNLTIKPQRTQSAQRGLRNSVGMKAVAESFAVSARSAVN